MIRLRKADERGHAEHGWLHSHHTFSFADYYDPAHMGHSVLRVINDDTVEPGKGFGTHPHRDMEIISYVLEGELEHKDSMGNGSIIRPGEVQRMSAGTGVTHSEFNPSREKRTHFLQIWIVPDRQGYAPGYEQKLFAAESVRNRFCCVASKDGRDGSLTLHQDAQMYLARLHEAGPHETKLHFTIAARRCAYVHLARGMLSMNGNAMQGGDGAYIDGATTLDFDAADQAEVLLFDLPERRN
jgi:quercetin 2,3-dioxygenase